MSMRPGGAIRRRLVGEGGVSILVALFFMLVCAMIAAVVVSSAAVNAERTRPHQTDEQAYLAVVSGLRAAEELVAGDGSAVRQLQMTKETGSSALNTTGYSVDDPLGLAEWVEEQARAIEGGGASVPKFITISADGISGADVPPVLLKFTMDNNYGINVQACEDVWGAEAVPDDDDARVAALSAKGHYGNLLSKQVAVSSASSSSAPYVRTWKPVGDA